MWRSLYIGKFAAKMLATATVVLLVLATLDNATQIGLLQPRYSTSAAKVPMVPRASIANTVTDDVPC